MLLPLPVVERSMFLPASTESVLMLVFTPFKTIEPSDAFADILSVAEKSIALASSAPESGVPMFPFSLVNTSVFV